MRRLKSKYSEIIANADIIIVQICKKQKEPVITDNMYEMRAQEACPTQISAQVDCPTRHHYMTF